MWLPTLHHCVERLVATCAVFRLIKPHEGLSAEQRTQLYSRPFRVLQVEAVGSITPAVRGCEHILHASCPLSGYTWLRAAPKNNGEVLPGVMVEDVFVDIACSRCF